MAKVDPTKIINFLNNKWGGRSCPMCEKGPWSVQDKVFQLIEFHQGSIVVGGPIIPVIPVSCGNCGYTVLVNAIIAEVVQPETQPATMTP